MDVEVVATSDAAESEDANANFATRHMMPIKKFAPAPLRFSSWRSISNKTGCGY
jgi:hypothetical protein